MNINLQLFGQSLEDIAKDVIKGKYGNGQARKDALGDKYAEVQAIVNTMLGGSSSTTTKPSTPTTTAPATPTAAPANNGFTYDKYVDPQNVTDAWNKVNTMQKPVEQESIWSPQFNDAINKILNKEPFSYDLNGDALYQQYKDQYMTQGKLASMDVMGQAAAMTGGYGSSYGQTVGHQAYQGYLQELNDKVPELYQLALNQYNQEYQDLKDQASMLKSLVDRDHDLYRESVSDYYTDRDYYTGKAEYLLEDAYTKWADKVGLDFDIYTNNQDQANKAKEQAYDTAMGMLSMGVTPSTQMLADAGISSDDANAIVKKVLANEATASSSGSGSGSGNNTWADDVKGSGGGSYINESAVNEFSKKVDDYTKNWDAVMRHMWGSPQQYIAQQIEESKLTDAEKAYLISKYGITEMHLNYKNK